MKNTILILVLILSTVKFNYAQILHSFPCYTVSSGNGQPNILYELHPYTNEWNRIGITGGTNIEAIATDVVSKIIYATDAGIFGTINRNTALFSAIGNIGVANGNFGLIDLNDIDGLTYDSFNKIMYATHKIEGIGSGTEDLLFQIDVSTGSFVPRAMTDPITGVLVDYVVVQAVFEGTFGGNVYDVEDIAYNGYTGDMFALQTQERFGVITILNPQTGLIETVAMDIADDDVKGLGFTYLGELYGTTGDKGITPQESNAFIFIDLVGQSTSLLSAIDPTGVAVDFESFDCLTSFNDLALDMVATNPFPAFPGGNVTFSITIYNQGDIDNYDIILTDYIPPGLTLNDAVWTNLGNGKASTSISGPLINGTSLTIPITFRVDNNFNGNLTNTVEISSSNSIYITDPFGNVLPLPDIDSQPNDINDENEIYVIDNVINQGGPNAYEDEDDHDIATISIKPCTIQFKTNYSGCVALVLDNNQNILKNSYVTVYDYSTCQNYTNLGNCSPVIGNNNLSANEAFWAATETAKYFLEKHDFQMPHINIIVNCSKEPNEAAYKLGHNTIILGKGDNITRTSMTSIDIVAHEIIHHLIAAISEEQFGVYGETGALQESFADIFAEVIEKEIKGTNDWVIGREVTKDGKGIRSLQNPKSFMHPNTYEGDHWIDQITCYNIVDNCGTHTNNSVQNYWFYLLTNGGIDINDNDLPYNIIGLGMEKAAKIVFKSLFSYLKSDAIYIDAKNETIKAAKDLFGLFDSEKTKNAWDAVGCSDSAFKGFNYLRFSTENYDDRVITGDIVQIEFDLLIDSLGQDISADGLQITFDTKGQYENLEVLTVYPPLAIEDLTVSQSSKNTTVKIERDSGQFKKSQNKLPKIKSGEPIFRMVACVLEDDIPIDSTSTKPMDISGFSSSRNGFTNFEDHSLIFMDPYGNALNIDGTSVLPAKFTINHQNCRTLGSADISILTNIGEAPFTYSIIDVANDVTTYTADTNIENHTVYNLEQGNYQLEIRDKNGKKGLFELIVKFNATFDSSINCLNDICPSFLSVNYDNIKGIYIAQNEIEIKGSIVYIKEDVIFSVCE